MTNNLKIIFYVLLFVAVILEVVADILFKRYGFEKKSWLIILGLALYFVGTIFWAISLKYEDLSKAISLFVILNLIFVTLAGIFLFKEQLSITNKIGIILGMISVILIEL